MRLGASHHCLLLEDVRGVRTRRTRARVAMDIMTRERPMVKQPKRPPDEEALFRVLSRQSGVDAALADRVRNAVDREHVGRDTVVNLVGLSVADDVVERGLHDGFQLFVDH